jgi:GT2 family glycosyltransferase
LDDHDAVVMTVTVNDGPSLSAAHVIRGARVPASPGLSIIVLVTNRTELLERCLASIRAADPAGPSAEVIVLANGTPDESVTSLSGHDDIVVIRSHVNHGFGGGGNWAARFARGARLVFVNDDAVVAPGWLTALNRAMDSDPRLAVVGSRVLMHDGVLQEAGGVIWRDGTTSGIGRGLAADDSRFLSLRDVDYVSFSSAMIRREAWDAAGGFDERYYPAYYEDADLCLTLHGMGWRVACEPASLITHEEGASTAVHYRHFLSRRSQRRFIEKWASELARHQPRPPHAGAAALTAAALVATATRRRTPTPDEHASSPALAARAELPGLVDRSRGDAVIADEGVRESVEARHLAAEVAVKSEYITHLTAELEGYRFSDLARRRSLAARRRIGAGLRRHPRLARLARRLIAGTGLRA